MFWAGFVVKYADIPAWERGVAMTRSHTCLFALVLVMASIRAVPAAESQSNSISELQAAIETVLKVTHTPGVGIAIVFSNRTEWIAGLGKADVAANVPATADTLFRIGSVSKGFAALAALQLQEQGKLKLTDTVRQWVPEVSFGPIGACSACASGPIEPRPRRQFRWLCCWDWRMWSSSSSARQSGQFWVSRRQWVRCSASAASATAQRASYSASIWEAVTISLPMSSVMWVLPCVVFMSSAYNIVAQGAIII